MKRVVVVTEWRSTTEVLVDDEFEDDILDGVDYEGTPIIEIVEESWRSLVDWHVL